MQPASPHIEIIEVIPLLRLPRTLGVFDYLGNVEIPAPLAPGQLVAVPFRGRMVTAVVLDTKRQVPDPRLRYRPIFAVVTPKPFVSRTQLALAQWMSAYYLQSLANILRAMIPALPAHFPFANPIGEIQPPPLPAVPPDQQKLLDGLIASPGARLLHGEMPPSWLAYLAARVVGRGKQVLIIVPEMGRGKLLLQVLQQSLGSLVVMQPDAASKLAAVEFWLRVASGAPLVVVGTRRAVFAPLNQLALVVVMDEEDASLKQWDQNPRYHARETAGKLAELSGAALLYTSVSPSVVSHWRAAQGLFPSHTSPASPAAAVELVDMRTEFAARNFAPLSRRLQELLLAGADRPGLQALLVVNRKGAASFVRCRDCGFVPRCPQCEMPFRHLLAGTLPAGGLDQIPATTDDLYCYRCRQAARLPPNCPDCRGVNLRPVGAGVQRVVPFVRGLLPGAAVRRFDADLPSAEQAEVMADVAAGRVGVLIATSRVLHVAELNAVPLVAVLSPDSSLQQPDFSATEQTLHLLVRAKRIARIYFLVQTTLPNHPLYQSLASGLTEPFYQREEKARQEFSYPPFCQLISLTYHHRDAAHAEREAKRVASLVRERCRSAGNPVVIIGPNPGATVRRSRRFAWQIILKLDILADGHVWPPTPPHLDGKPMAVWLADVPDTWVIDVDPIAL